MECEKTPLLKHLAVHEPDQLSTEPWRTHVEECAACHAEWRVFAASLAIYCHVEREDAARHPFRPSWEAYRRRLDGQRQDHRRLSLVTGTWLAGMMGLVLVGGAMSWGLWDEGGSHTGTALVMDEEALTMVYPEYAEPAHPVLAPTRAVPIPAGSYGPLGAESRILRRWRLLEPHTQASGRPLSEVAIIPFSHGNGATPYVMPSTSAPGSGIRLHYVSAPANSGGYVLSAPVR